MKHFIASFLLFLLVGIFTNPLVVFAEDNTDALLAISDDETLSDEERFVAAKDGLILALNLALEKVNELKSNLEGRSFDDGSRENEIKIVFLEDLASYNEYYSNSLEVAQSIDALDGVQVLAQEIRDYRDITYTPGVEEIVQFILVFYSQDIIGTANERLAKILEDIDTLESIGLIEKDSFSGQIEDVTVLLTQAAELQVEARNMALMLPTDTATITDLDNTEVLSSTTTEAIPDTEDMESDEEVGPLEKSLNNVKAVYEIFLEVSKSVKETLGIE